MSDLPPLPSDSGYKAPKPAQKPKAKKPSARKRPPKVSGPAVVKKDIKAPVMQGWNGYSRRRVDLMLDASQADTLRDLQQGLMSDKATLKNGNPVQRPNDALRWLLEQLK